MWIQRLALRSLTLTLAITLSLSLSLTLPLSLSLTLTLTLTRYVGKTAVSRGKEVAAITLQAAAESEAILAQAERAKAVVPLCVGLSATASAFALLAPEVSPEPRPQP